MCYINSSRKVLFVFIILCTLFSSCRKEELELIQPSDEENLIADSNVAKLMQRTTLKDGSKDNIVDKANCFTVKFPVTVTLDNGTQIIVESEEEYDTIEHVFDMYDDDYGYVTIHFPITIILDDFSEVTISNQIEFDNYANNCSGENEVDNDIECIDFKYPIKANIFNTNNELLNSVSLEDDYQLYNFTKNLNDSDIVAIVFPISVILFDNTELVINNLPNLEDAIANSISVCDEDDDYNYNDDDCNDCNVEQLIAELTSCDDWIVDKLERYHNDYDDYYDGYTFHFYTDGTISAYYDQNEYYGTYTSYGSGNNITVVINIPSLPYCNNNWILHEITENSETKIDFRVEYGDRLRYKNNCD